MRPTPIHLLAAALALVLSACGRDEPPPPPDYPPAAVAQPDSAPSQPDPGYSGNVESTAGGELTEAERAAIESQKADGEAVTDGDGVDTEGHVRTHTEAETADAEATETPEDDEDGG